MMDGEENEIGEQALDGLATAEEVQAEVDQIVEATFLGPRLVPYTGLAVGRGVHYVARGSLDGVFPSVCRAAVVTEVLDARLGIVRLCVLNPTGIFFSDALAYGEQNQPGTWHWEEAVT